jgi:perosamine synthetase
MITVPISAPTISKQDIAAVTDCLESGWISSAGPAIDKFGLVFARLVGAKYALPVATGTAALHLALLALRIKTQDEVIVPAFTFVSPASMVAALGAKPVFVDVLPNHVVMNPTEVEKKVTPRTRAIIVVHLYGYPVELSPILALAKKHHLAVIEDCAEALGARYRGKQVGSFGDIACFSFYANKFITTGEGGMITTNNKDLFQKVRLYCDHGMTKKRRYYHRVVGFNYRMTAMQASLGLSQLKRLPRFMRQRQQILATYQKQLKPVPEIEWLKPLPQTQPVNWLTTCLLPNQTTRNRLMAFLQDKGVETRKVFFPIPGMPPYPTSQHFPWTQSVSERGLSLPTFTDLTDRQIRFICDQIQAFFD